MTAPSSTARIIHLALAGTVVASALIMALLPMQASMVLPLFLYAVFGVAAVLFAGALVISSRLPRESGQTVDAWWAQNLSRAIVVWAMLEGPSLLGSIAFMLSRDITALLIPAVGLALLFMLGPGRLEQA